jgi:hypothetical protein
VVQQQIPPWDWKKKASWRHSLDILTKQQIPNCCLDGKGRKYTVAPKKIEQPFTTTFSVLLMAVLQILPGPTNP